MLLCYDRVRHLDNLVSLAEIEYGPCDFRRMVTRHELDTIIFNAIIMERNLWLMVSSAIMAAYGHRLATYLKTLILCINHRLHVDGSDDLL